MNSRLSAERTRQRSSILKAREVKEYLGLSLPAVYRALHRGDIPAERVGGAWRIKRRQFFDKFGWPGERRETIQEAGPALSRPSPRGAESRKAAPASRPSTGEKKRRLSEQDTHHQDSEVAAGLARGASLAPQRDAMKGTAEMSDPSRFGTPEKPWRDTDYAAERIGCTPSYVRHLCRSKELAYKKKGHIYQFVDDWIDEYIDRHRSDPARGEDVA